MLIELTIGEIQITGLTGINATQLRIAIDNALQTLLTKHSLPKKLLKNSSIIYEEIAFSIKKNTSIEKIAAQIASNIVNEFYN